jgi:hypothetical protein
MVTNTGRMIRVSDGMVTRRGRILFDSFRSPARDLASMDLPILMRRTLGGRLGGTFARGAASSTAIHGGDRSARGYGQPGVSGRVRRSGLR